MKFFNMKYQFRKSQGGGVVLYNSLFHVPEDLRLKTAQSNGLKIDGVPFDLGIGG